MDLGDLWSDCVGLLFERDGKRNGGCRKRLIGRRPCLCCCGPKTCTCPLWVNMSAVIKFCVRWRIGLCTFLCSADPTGLLGRALKLPLASPWKRMELVYYNHSHTILTKEGRMLHFLWRQYGSDSELKEIQKITWKISKWYNYFYRGLPD